MWARYWHKRILLGVFVCAMGEERKTCPSARISKVLSQSLAEKNCFTQTAPVRRTAAAYRSPSAVSVFIKREGAVESVSVKQLCRLSTRIGKVIGDSISNNNNRDRNIERRWLYFLKGVFQGDTVDLLTDLSNDVFSCKCVWILYAWQAPNFRPNENPW